MEIVEQLVLAAAFVVHARGVYDRLVSPRAHTAAELEASSVLSAPRVHAHDWRLLWDAWVGSPVRRRLWLKCY